MLRKKHFWLLSPDDTGGSNSTPADAQAANGGSTSAQAATQTTPDAQAADGQETITLEEARRLRSESKALRARLNKFEDEDKKRAEAQLSEQQKLEKRAADAEKALADKEQAYQARLLQAEIRSQAAQLGIKYPDKAAKLIDTADIALDDATMPSKVKAALTELLKEMPELGPQTGTQQKQAATSGGATNPSKGATGNQEINQAYVNRLMGNKTEWDALSPQQRADVLNWTAKNPYRF